MNDKEKVIQETAKMLWYASCNLMSLALRKGEDAEKALHLKKMAEQLQTIQTDIAFAHFELFVVRDE